MTTPTPRCVAVHHRARGRADRLFPLTCSLVLVWLALGGALLAFAGPASAINFCHEFRAQLKDDSSNVIASAGGFSNGDRMLSGTLQPGRYFIVVDGGASSSVDFNDVPNPGYCNISGDMTFDLATTPSPGPGWDRTYRRVTARADAETASAQQEFVEIVHNGDFSATLGKEVAASSQVGSTFIAMDSSFSGSGIPSGLSVRLDVFTHGSNQFMAGFPGPSGSSSLAVQWLFTVSQSTDWTLDLHSEVDEGPPTSLVAALLPFALAGDERIYAINADNPVAIIVEPGSLDLVLEDGTLDAIIETALPEAQINTNAYEVIIESGSLGVFPAASLVDFVALTGGSVPGFRLVPQGDSGGIPLTLYEIGLTFQNPPTSGLRIIPVPEPSAPLLSAAAISVLAFLRRRASRSLTH